MRELTSCPTQREQDSVESVVYYPKELYAQGYREHPYLPTSDEIPGLPLGDEPPSTRPKEAAPRELFEQCSLKVTVVLNPGEWTNLQWRYKGPTEAKKKILAELQKILGVYAAETQPGEES